jgi:hypothetical protein
MTEQTFPDIQAATEAMQKRIELTEAEIAQLQETIAAKKQLVRAWRKGIAAVSPKRSGGNKQPNLAPEATSADREVKKHSRFDQSRFEEGSIV